MPRSWSSKDERQYEHVKESELDQGRTPKVAKRIAAATVNKQRTKDGRTSESDSGKASGGPKHPRSSSRPGRTASSARSAQGRRRKARSSK